MRMDTSLARRILAEMTLFFLSLALALGLSDRAAFETILDSRKTGEFQYL